VIKKVSGFRIEGLALFAKISGQMVKRLAKISVD
jgi:hypothetical protein